MKCGRMSPSLSRVYYAEPPPSKFDRIRGQLQPLIEMPMPQIGEISELLQDLQEIIFDYQVRP